MNDFSLFVTSEFKKLFSDKLKKSLEISFDDIIAQLCSLHEISKSEIDHLDSLQEWYLNITNLEYLQDFLKYENLEEVIVHNTCTCEVITRQKKEKKEICLDLEDFMSSLEYLSRSFENEWNYSTPFSSFNVSLSDNEYRATLIHPSITQTRSPKLFLRRISSSKLKLEDFNIDSKLQETITTLIKNKKNIIISGSTASGKTTFLSSLTSHFCNEEHIVVIEDTHEISGCSRNYTHLLSSKLPGKTMKDFCAYALRMSPQRILLGEIRSNEVVPFILSMNTGHKGLLSTIHANDARDTLLRLCMLFGLYGDSSTSISHELILKLICSNIDYVIHLENKEINEIIEVKGSEGDTPIFNFIYQRDTEQTDLLSFLNQAS